MKAVVVVKVNSLPTLLVVLFQNTFKVHSNDHEFSQTNSLHPIFFPFISPLILGDNLFTKRAARAGYAQAVSQVQLFADLWTVV